MMAERNFVKRALVHPELGPSLPPSMPLVIPNDQEYDFSSNTLQSIPGERRSSLKIVPETLRLIEELSGPVAMLSIGGPCRSGKSYILSRMLGSGDAFALGHLMDPKTFGIWVGTTVLQCEEFSLLLMDTEGIDAAHARARDDASILVMTVLLSSYFIYNSMNVPKKSDLQQMSFFTKLATSIAVKDQNNEEDSFDLKEHFPDFLWLLRDVTLIPTVDGKEVSFTDFLLKKVLVRGKSFNESESERVSRSILSFFPTIEGTSLPPPSTDKAIMQNIARFQNKLNPEFNREVEILVKNLFQRVRGKRGFQAGKLMDGPILATMATQYIEAINDPNAIPCINDTWWAAIEMRCRKVMESLLKEYRTEMDAQVAKKGYPMEEDSPYDDPSSPSTLFGIHRSVLLLKIKELTKQVGHFVRSHVTDDSFFNISSLHAELEHETAVFNEDGTTYNVLGKQVKRKLVEGGLLLSYVQQNHSASRSSCIHVFEELYRSVDEHIAQEDHKYTFKQLLKDLEKLQRDYFNKAVGPAKWEVYTEKQTFIKSQQEAYKLLHGFKMKAFQESQKVTEERAKAAKLEESICVLQTQMRNDAEMNQQRLQNIELQHRAEMEKFRQDQLERMENERERAEHFMKAQMTQMAEMAKENQKQMKEQFQLMTHTMELMSKQNKESMDVLSKTVEKFSDAVQSMKANNSPGGGLFTFVGKILDKLF